MRLLNILGWFSHFLVVTLFLFGIVTLFLLVNTLNSDDFTQWIVLYNSTEISENKEWYVKSFLIISYCLYLIYFTAIFLLNLCIRQFEKRNFFTSKNASRMNIVGILFLFNYCVTFALQKLFKVSLLTAEEIVSGGGSYLSDFLFDELQTPLSGLFMGVFFVVLGQVFKQAIVYKEENELTV